jgi:hypothetical protein
VRHIFRNLNHFVRENPELFPPGSATEEPIADGSLKIKNSKAARGLNSLFHERWVKHLGRKYQPLTWHGWRAEWKKDRLGAIVWTRAEPLEPPDSESVTQV